MSTTIKKYIARLKKVLHQKSNLDTNECGVFCDWSRILLGATLLALTLALLGGYLFFTTQQLNNRAIEQQEVAGKTFDKEKLNWLINSYQARAVEFDTLRKNPPTIPQTGFNTVEVLINNEEEVVEETQNTNQADWRTLQ